MGTPEPICVVVADANVLINLIHVDRLGLLGALVGYEFVVPPEVEAEISIPDQVRTLAHAFDVGHIRRQAFTSTEELGIYAEHTRVLGRGEAACLAMAEVQGWYIASDEKRKFQKLAKERLGTGRILTTPGVFVLAICANLISVEEADMDKLELAEHRFKMRFSSFREVIG